MGEESAPLFAAEITPRSDSDWTYLLDTDLEGIAQYVGAILTQSGVCMVDIYASMEYLPDLDDWRISYILLLFESAGRWESSSAGGLRKSWLVQSQEQLAEDACRAIQTDGRLTVTGLRALYRRGELGVRRSNRPPGIIQFPREPDAE